LIIDLRKKRFYFGEVKYVVDGKFSLIKDGRGIKMKINGKERFQGVFSDNCIEKIGRFSCEDFMY
jgi:hypothetical protein